MAAGNARPAVSEQENHERPEKHVGPSMAHDANHEAFAQAAMLCQGYAPECSYKGRCLLDDECFSRPKRGRL
jgi:hypothetical protein